LGAIYLLLVLPVLAQQGILLERLDIRYDSKVNVSKRTYQKQYQNRVFTSQLSSEIKAKILEDLKDQGYYFAEIDSSAIKVDSIRNAVQMFLRVRSGNRLKLNEVTILNIDSLSVELGERVIDQIESYPGKYYTDLLVKSLFRDIVGVLENNGYPLARVYTGDFKFTESPDEKEWLLNLDLEISPGDSIQIVYLRFPKQRSNLTSYLQRLLRFNPGQQYQEKKVSKYITILRRQEFIKQVQQPVLAQDKDGKYFLSIDFEETPSTTFDGIIGYVPPPANQADEKGYFTGLINIGVRNLFGGERKLQVFWQKQDRLSDEFRLAYREPFIFGLPFHTQVGMDRLVRDTTYIEWHYRGNFEFPFNEVLSAYISLANRNVAPDSLASRQLRLPITESWISETGIRWDLRNDLQNPIRGLNLDISFSLNRQKNKGPTYLLAEDSLRESVTLQRMRADLSLFLPTFKRQVLANLLHLEFVENSKEVLRPPDQVWFGGARTVRGFREDQFFARRVAWLNTEYRLLLGPRTRFFVFTDNAFYSRDYPDKVDQWLTSYGLGLRLEGPLGIMQVDYGLEKGASFQEGKLHFRVINEF
jgi:outer membrane protein insertion porin family